jgi:pyruvoyl-dependent arginine decarboxylase
MAQAHAEQLQSTGSEAPGLDISIRTGSGAGRTLLSAFDHALQQAGVADFNLVTLSSVIPPGSRIRNVNGKLAGGHGDLLFCVRAEAFAEHPGDIAWAGLGWCLDETGGGLFVEHHGGSERSVVEQIELSLADMNANRGGGYGPVQIALASAHSTGFPVCAVVVAAYRVSTWHEPGHEPRPDPAEISAEAARHQRPTQNGTVPHATHAHALNGSFVGDPARAESPAYEAVQTATAEADLHEREPADLEPSEREPSEREPAEREPADLEPSASEEASEPGGEPAQSVPHVPEIRVTMEKEVDYATAKLYYQLYRDTFGELETTAVARQLLHESEFLEEMLDPRVEKWVAWDDEGQAIGMTTLTKDLATVPWIEPGYFAHNYPEHHARDAIFYLGFTLVHPAHRGIHIFHAMIEPMTKRVAAENAVCAWDMCLANDERGLGGSAGRLIRSLANATIEPIDKQTYYAATFHGPQQTA